jgi:hypothetical protein
VAILAQLHRPHLLLPPVKQGCRWLIFMEARLLPFFDPQTSVEQAAQGAR